MTADPDPKRLARLVEAALPLIEGERPRIGRYEIVRELGSGGMGVVYEARDPVLGRSVALKMLTGLVDAAARERFEREARAAARLRHPHVAEVYEAGPDFIAMRLIDGPSLSGIASNDVRRLVGFVRDAARAVDVAHAQGIVHRDLKPENLLIEGDHVFVTDFGVAKDLTASHAASLSGDVIGTPGFMAPEQVRGDRAAIDARTDVWGLGATLWALLADRPPFVDPTLPGLFRKIVEDAPPALRTLASAVPSDLETIALRALEKERARRYPSAAAFADDLDRWLDGRPVLATRPSLGYRAAKFARRRRAPLAAAALGAAIVLVFAVFLWKERAAREASNDALALSETVAEVLANREVFRRLGENARVRAEIDRGVSACEAFLAEHEVPVGRLLLGKLERLRGRNEEAILALDLALAVEPGFHEARLERGLAAAEIFWRRSAEAATGGVPVAPSVLDGLRRSAEGDLAASASSGGGRAVDRAFARGMLLELSGDVVAARVAFEETLRLDGVHEGAMLALARLDLAAGDTESARRRAMSALDLFRGLGPAYLAPRSGAAGQ